MHNTGIHPNALTVILAGAAWIAACATPAKAPPRCPPSPSAPATAERAHSSAVPVAAEAEARPTYDKPPPPGLDVVRAPSPPPPGLKPTYHTALLVTFV